ncbi:MAG: alanine racemase, partial [Elusimicrobia bacterium]|nr:alanine racemase [Elusimicrobiota bacterium]
LYPFESFAAALENDLVPTVASRAAAQALSTAASDIKKQVPVHMKVDTGMGRIGMTPEAALETAQTIMNAPALSLEAIYTHLAYADSVEFTRNQLDLFRSTLDPIRRWVPRVLAHAANSAATFQCPQSHYDMVRPGLALYGIHPFPQTMGKAELAPVLSWKTKVVFLKTVQPGTSVSYGATYRTSRPSRLATLPVGYADGYRRLFTNKGWVLVKGRRCPVVGRVTMDQTIVDVTDVPGVDVGEDVVLIGAQGQDRITVEEMAGWADTISYEIVCGIAPRVPRITKETI